MLAMRESDRIDDLLDFRALSEVALLLLAAVRDLLHEVMDEVRVEERRPRLAGWVPGRGEPLGYLHRDELDRIRLRAAQGLALAELLDQAADERALGSVDARLDARIVPHGDKARLQRVQRAIRTLADEHVGVVDVDANAVRVEVRRAPERDHVAQDADHLCEVAPHAREADVDRRRAVALE